MSSKSPADLVGLAPGSKLRSVRISSRKAIAILCSILAFTLFLSHRSLRDQVVLQFYDPEQKLRQLEVEEAFRHAWKGYSEHCFGHDTLHPVSNTCGDDFGGWGATAIDSLSTAILFNENEIVVQILDFIAALDMSTVKKGTKLQVFEVNIRHLGAMISAWDLLNGPYKHLAQSESLRNALRSQMIRLADALSCSFQTGSGIPADWVDPASCSIDVQQSTPLAGVGTMILEFGRVSDITGDRTYVDLVQKAEAFLLHPQPSSSEPMPGLLGSNVNARTGEIMGSSGSWGGNSDSYYEYLIKAFIYDSQKYGEYLDRWLVAVDSTIRFVASHPYGHPEWTLLPSWDGKEMGHTMESLTFFAGGNIILGGMVTANQTLIDFGLSIADVAGAIYQKTATGLGPEFVFWTTDCDPSWGSLCNANNSIRIFGPRFRLRPEVVETWYYAYRATRNPKYREWSWSAFQAIVRHCKTDTGFSTLSDVDHPQGGSKTDDQESFVMAEVFKYIYLTQLEDGDTPVQIQDSRTGVRNGWVFNTEAHPFKVVGREV